MPRTKRTKTAADHGRVGSQEYFRSVADARYVIRQVLRLVDERARQNNLEPLEHQALIQIYGSRASEINVREVSERLDVAAAFCSKIVKSLVQKGFVLTRTSPHDQRVINLVASHSGENVLVAIDREVRTHVDYFTQQLSSQQKEAAIAIFAFYVGTHVKVLSHSRSMDRALLATLRA